MPARHGGRMSPPRVALDIWQGDEHWGEVVFELDAERSPATTANFLRYVDEGYYNGTLIHRVVFGPNARINVLQGGGYTRLGGPSKPGQHAAIRLESRNGLSNVRGTIAMARDAAPDTATSEFFVNIQDNKKLDYASAQKPGYCVFGHAVNGMEVVDRIAQIETVTNPDPELKGEKSLPVRPPVVRTARRVGSGEPRHEPG